MNVISKNGVSIALDETVQAGRHTVKVTRITLDIHSKDQFSDLTVHWNTDGLQNNGGGNMGQLMMRGWQDEVGEVMCWFYGQRGFQYRLREILIENGISVDAANDVCGSEWGMQAPGRASYDAYKMVEELLGFVVE